MKLSIIVPVYNAEPFLKRCLDSIRLRQNVELVLVDNGCTDNSREIMASFPGPKKIVVCLKNIGVSGARNEGMKKATGDYITFLDADDEYTPEGVETMLTAIKENPDADIIQFNHFVFLQNGWKRDPYRQKKGTYCPPELPGLWVIVWNKVYRRSALSGLTFDRGLSHGEDEVFNLEAMKRVKSVRALEYFTVFHHKDNPESLMKITKREHVIAEQRALLSFLETCKDDKLADQVRKRQTELWNTPTYRRVFGGAP